PQKYSSGTFWGTTDEGRGSVPAPGRALPAGRALPSFRQGAPGTSCRPGSRTHAAAEFLVDPSPPRPRPNRGLRPFSAFTKPVRWAHGTWTGGARIVAAPPLTRDRDDATAYRPHLARRRPARLCRPCRRPGEPRRPPHPAARLDERRGRDRAVRGDHVHGRALPLLRGLRFRQQRARAADRRRVPDVRAPAPGIRLLQLRQEAARDPRRGHLLRR